jgi:hypothetical protein
MTWPGIRVSLRGDRERSGDHAGSPSSRVSVGIVRVLHFVPKFPHLREGGKRDVFQPGRGCAENFLRLDIEFEEY